MQLYYVSNQQLKLGEVDGSVSERGKNCAMRTEIMQKTLMHKEKSIIHDYALDTQLSSNKLMKQ